MMQGPLVWVFVCQSQLCGTGKHIVSTIFCVGSTTNDKVVAVRERLSIRWFVYVCLLYVCMLYVYDDECMHYVGIYYVYINKSTEIYDNHTAVRVQII